MVLVTGVGGGSIILMFTVVENVKLVPKIPVNVFVIMYVSEAIVSGFVHVMLAVEVLKASQLGSALD